MFMFLCRKLFENDNRSMKIDNLPVMERTYFYAP